MASRKLAKRRRWCLAIGIPFGLGIVALRIVRAETEAAKDLTLMGQFVCVAAIVILLLASYPHPLRDMTRSLASERQKVFREKRRSKHKRR